VETAWGNLCLVRRITKDISYNSSRQCLTVFTIQLSEQRATVSTCCPLALLNLNLSLSLSLAPPFSATRRSLIIRSLLPCAVLALRGFASSWLGSHPHLLPSARLGGPPSRRAPQSWPLSESSSGDSLSCCCRVGVRCVLRRLG